MSQIAPIIEELRLREQSYYRRGLWLIATAWITFLAFLIAGWVADQL